jgi:hypothetical protein
MPIKFDCPHCHKKLSVKDHLAGKKGPCPACKKVVTIPGTAAIQAAAPAPNPVDVEAEAAAALSDEPAAEAPVDTRTVDFECPFCSEMLHLGAELAGKKTSCPECRRIIKVPELTRQGPKDWRKADKAGPSGARRPEEVAPEGAWGSTAAAAVSQQALAEAKAIPQAKQPLTGKQWAVRGSMAVGGLLVLVFGGLLVWNWVGRSREQKVLQRALDYAGSDAAAGKVGRDGVAALHGLAGEYYLRGRRSNAAEEARKQFDKALSQLAESDSPERDGVLLDLALAQLGLEGSQEEIDKGQRVKWEEAQKAVRGSLALLHSEPRLNGLVAVSRQLIARGQAERALGLAGQVATTPGEKMDAYALVGIELYRAGQHDLARQALTQAAEPAEDPPADPAAEPADPPAPKPAKPSGPTAALAALAQLLKAPVEGMVNHKNAEVQLRMALALAAARDEASGDNKDLEKALKLAEGELKNNPRVSWAVVRLVEVAARSGIAEERLRVVAAAIPEREVRGRAQLVLFRARLAQNKDKVDDGAADAVNPKTLSHLLARAALARHNTRQNRGWADAVEKWDEGPRAFGQVGAALGMQGEP